MIRIGGKQYLPMSAHKTKGEAQKHAQAIRKGGYTARVRPDRDLPGMWCVYVGPKKKKEKTIMPKWKTERYEIRKGEPKGYKITLPAAQAPDKDKHVIKVYPRFVHYPRKYVDAWEVSYAGTEKHFKEPDAHGKALRYTRKLQRAIVFRALKGKKTLYCILPRSAFPVLQKFASAARTWGSYGTLQMRLSSSGILFRVFGGNHYRGRRKQSQLIWRVPLNALEDISSNWTGIHSFEYRDPTVFARDISWLTKKPTPFIAFQIPLGRKWRKTMFLANYNIDFPDAYRVRKKVKVSRISNAETRDIPRIRKPKPFAVVSRSALASALEHLKPTKKRHIAWVRLYIPKAKARLEIQGGIYRDKKQVTMVETAIKPKVARRGGGRLSAANLKAVIGSIKAQHHKGVVNLAYRRGGLLIYFVPAITITQKKTLKSLTTMYHIETAYWRP